MRTMRWIQTGIVSAALVLGGAAFAEPGGDQSFLTQALATNRLELALGRLAIERAATPAVQEMGKKMVEKHTALGQQLGERAVALGAAAPAEMSSTEKATFARLSALPSGQFDETFKVTIDDIHRRELALYESEAKSATSPELRTLVEGRVVALRKNLVPAKRAKDW